MAGILGDGSACTIRGLIWALGRESLNNEKPEALKSKTKKCFLELKLINAYEQFEKILNFISSVEHSNTDSTASDVDGSNSKGIYMKIFATGLLEVIRSFGCDLIEIEKCLLLDPTGISTESLASVQLMYDTYTAINSIIQQMSDGNLNGCQILDLCHKAALMSQITIVSKLHILAGRLHKQMLKQIKSWSLYGELDDPYGEFFIGGSSELPSDGFDGKQGLLFQRCSFDTSMSIDFCPSLIESTSTSVPFCKAAQELAVDDIDNRYDIVPSHLPSHLPYSLASKILRLGKFMIQIKNNPSNKIPVSFMNVNLSDYGVDEVRIKSMLKQAEDSSTFHHHTLEKVIDFTWCQMNRYMKRVAEEEGDLSSHHNNITDVYLMGRGVLLRHFLEKSYHLLINDAAKVHSRSLDLVLERVAQDLYGTDNINFLRRFQFYLPPKAETPSGRSVLSVMKLIYKPPWPLPLIYSQDVLDTYNDIFIFLLNMKRAHKHLTQAWNDVNSIQDDMLNRFSHELHFRLTSLITDLQSYIFVDVILSEMDCFSETLRAKDSFEEIMKAHAKFLSNIVLRLFLPSNCDKLTVENQINSVEFRSNVGTVHKEILNLFSTVNEFAIAIRVMGFDSTGGQKKLNDLSKKFESSVINLISTVKRINEKYCCEYLGVLIMRLDYNEYYINKYNI